MEPCNHQLVVFILVVRKPISHSNNAIQYVTIATTGNTSDFGDTNQTAVTLHPSATCNAIRGLLIHGYDANPGYTNKIEFITIATLGNY